MLNTGQATSQLLSVDSKKGTSEHGTIRAHPLIYAVLNLFFCGYFDRYIKNDPGGYYLSLFLFVECSLCILFAIGYFMQVSREVVLKSSVFPVSSLSRFMYVSLSFLRRPLFLFLWMTNLLFLIVFYRTQVTTVIFAILLFTLLIIDFVLITSFVSPRMARSSRPLAGIAVIVLFGVLIVVVSSLVFEYNSLLSGIPLISWATSGILAARQANMPSALLNTMSLAAVLVLALLVGRKFS